MLDILIPAYNCAETIPTTLSSLVNQTNKNFNVIIYNDASVEELSDAIEPFMELLNINYVIGDVNLGLGGARQALIDNSTSEFFIFVDADDILLENAVELFYKYSTQSNMDNIDIFVSDFYQENQNNELRAYEYPNNFGMTHGKFYKRAFIDKYAIKSVQSIYIVDDMCFSLRCLELGSVYHIKEKTAVWKYNAKSITRQDNSDIISYNIVHCYYDVLKFVLNYKPINKIKYAKTMYAQVCTINKRASIERLSEKSKLLLDSYTKQFFSLYNKASFKHTPFSMF